MDYLSWFKDLFKRRVYCINIILLDSCLIYETHPLIENKLYYMDIDQCSITGV